MNLTMCAEKLSRCDELHLQGIYTSLEYERLTRKYGDLLALFEGAGGSNWGQTFYLLFMRSLGDEVNKEVFMEIAHRLPLASLTREKGDPLKVEAMLIGVSGFLDSYSNKEYLEPIKREAKYLMHKYQIAPLSIAHWDMKRIRPYNHPVVRLSQVATLITSHDILFSDILECKTRQDIDNIFKVNASKHLCNTHPNLLREEGSNITLGDTKRNLLGINLVVPIQYAYGSYFSDDNLCANAQELNENLAAEFNRYIKPWREKGVTPHSAFESQAIIQLTTCYCQKNRCIECPVGRRISQGVI